MSKKRVGLYIEEDVWNVAKEAAWSRKVSLSSYIEGLIEYPDLVPPMVIIPERPPKPFIPLVMTDKESNAWADAGKKGVVDYRGKYKLMNPTKMCPGCRRKNKDCECVT